MQLVHHNTLDALRRVQKFLDTQAQALAAVVTVTLRARLDNVIVMLTTFQVEQSASDGAARGETASQAAYRQEFYAAFMRPIARITKRSLKNVPEFPTLTVPSRGVRNGDFVGSAQALADAAAKYEKTFVDGGMAADFLAQLRAAITQMATSKDARDRNISRRAAATQGLETATSTAHDVLVVLDSVIEPAIRKDASLLADWKASKRIAVATTPMPSMPLGLPAADATASGTGTTTPATPPAPQPPTPGV